MFQAVSATSHLECNWRVQQISASGSEYACVFLWWRGKWTLQPIQSFSLFLTWITLRQLLQRKIPKKAKSDPTDPMLGQRTQILDKEVFYDSVACLSFLCSLMLMQRPNMLLAGAISHKIFSVESIFLALMSTDHTLQDILRPLYLILGWPTSNRALDLRIYDLVFSIRQY